MGVPETDPWATRQKGLTAPADKWLAITPHDTNALSVKPRAITQDANGAAGNVTMKDADGTSLVLPIVPGQIIPVCPNIVMSTGTTATNLYALY